MSSSSDCLQYCLCSLFHDIKSSFLVLCRKKSIVTFPVKDPQKGKRSKCDFVLFLDPKLQNSTVVLCEIAKYLEKTSADWVLPLDRCIYTPHYLEIHLNRMVTMRRILHEVSLKGDEYGYWQSEPSCSVLVTSPALNRVCTNPELLQLRSYYIIETLINLLEANGIDVNVASDQEDISSLDCPWQIYSPLRRSATCEDYNPTSIVEAWKVRMIDSDYLIQKESSLGVLARKFLESHKLLSGYDKNIDCIYLEKNGITKACEHACFLEETVKVVAPVDKIIHVVSQKDAFLEQQSALLYQMCTQICDVKHLFVIHQSVSFRGDNKINRSAEDYYNNHLEVLEAAFLHKYDPAMLNSDVWKNSLSTLTLSCLVFDLLSLSLSTEVKLSPNCSCCSAKGGTFIQYNCSRLSVLFQKFHSLVENGVYPPLPSVENVDISTLKLEEEWSLLCSYILYYPILVKSIIEPLFSSKTTRVNVQVHRLCQFLIDLSVSLSVYYSKVRILTKPYPHLLPTMFARLWLLRCIQQVLHNGLSLMNLDAVAKM